jgi:hypoxanthine phosphoribosyltransferase
MKIIKDKSFVPFIEKEAIAARINEMAERINEIYAEKDPLLIGILNGSFMFLSDLFKQISIDCEVSFVRYSSYQKTSSTGIVNQLIGLKEDILDRDVIIVEDIVDTGRTIAKVKEQFEALKPKTLSIITLLHKPDAAVVTVPLDDIGFQIENKFVVGYGLDYDGFGRNLDSIYVLSE